MALLLKVYTLTLPTRKILLFYHSLTAVSMYILVSKIHLYIKMFPHLLFLLGGKRGQNTFSKLLSKLTHLVNIYQFPEYLFTLSLI